MGVGVGAWAYGRGRRCRWGVEITGEKLSVQSNDLYDQYERKEWVWAMGAADGVWALAQV